MYPVSHQSGLQIAYKDGMTTWQGVDWRGTNGLLIISLVHKDGSKIPHEINHEENGAFLRPKALGLATSD